MRPWRVREHELVVERGRLIIALNFYIHNITCSPVIQEIKLIEAGNSIHLF